MCSPDTMNDTETSPCQQPAPSMLALPPLSSVVVGRFWRASHAFIEELVDALKVAPFSTPPSWTRLRPRPFAQNDQRRLGSG